MAKPPRVCFDRLLPRDLFQFQHTIQRRGGPSRAISPIGKTWMTGSTLHVSFIGGSLAERAVAKEQANWWTVHANLNFVFENTPNAEIRVAFDSNDGAWSYVGTDARGIP